jgi:hypothetical protein
MAKKLAACTTIYRMYNVEEVALPEDPVIVICDVVSIPWGLCTNPIVLLLKFWALNEARI